MARKRARRKKKRFPEVGIVKISATFNNTIVSIGDFEGNILVWHTFCSPAGNGISRT